MATENIIAFFPVSERVKTAVQWEQATEDIWKNGLRIVINHFKEVRQVVLESR
jgi:ribosome biogenesis protein ERB1